MTNGEAVIAKLISEVADLTKANMLLHGIVSNREEEISGLRAQLASAAATLADIENGLQSAQIRDFIHASDCAVNNAPALLPGPCDCEAGRLAKLAGDDNPNPDSEPDTVRLHREKCEALEKLWAVQRQLASARKALEAALPIVSDRCAGGRMITPREDASKAFYLIQSALTDEKSK